MISVEGLKVEFSARPLFHDVSFVINDRDRIALVGKNGAGKSTLLKILCGQLQPTAGTVAIPNDTTIGYLPQVMKLQDNTTVREETRKAFASSWLPKWLSAPTTRATTICSLWSATHKSTIDT